jgi:hypothetical protein
MCKQTVASSLISVNDKSDAPCNHLWEKSFSFEKGQMMRQKALLSLGQTYAQALTTSTLQDERQHLLQASVHCALTLMADTSCKPALSLEARCLLVQLLLEHTPDNDASMTEYIAHVMEQSVCLHWLLILALLNLWMDRCCWRNR